jgi:hypothetical protein
VRQYDGEGSLKNIVNFIDPIPACAGMTKKKAEMTKKKAWTKEKQKKSPDRGDFLFHAGWDCLAV